MAHLAQLRKLARKFEGAEKVKGEALPLRLMPQHIVTRMPTVRLGVRDEPEVLIQFEARRNDAGIHR